MAQRSIALVFMLVGAVSVASGFLIPAKALLAQILLQHAWEKTLAIKNAGQGMTIKPAVRPWPWADTWPVGRIRVADLGVEQVILEGSSGEVLAFGPGHEPGSGLPGSRKHVVLYGHRNTSFSFVKELRQNDIIELEGAEGEVRYRVRRAEIVDASELFLDKDDAGGYLSLVTCYPFVQPVPGSTQRYLITAEML